MNLILCSQAQYREGFIELEGDRAEHVRCVHRAKEGDLLRVGVLGGKMGQARVLSIARRKVRLQIESSFEQEPPLPHPLTLAVAMCRPPSLHKVLAHATSMGVKHFMVFHTRRSEKSFWDSHAMQEEAIEQSFRLGLEQARDTMLPKIEWFRRFLPFAEDVLAPRMQTQPVWLADPNASIHGFQGHQAKPEPATLVIGPEGGFVPFERDRLMELGAQGVNLGPRILRVEVATVSLLANYSMLEARA